jgi:Ca2+-transporting ATPase
LALQVFCNRHVVKNLQSATSLPERGLTRHEAAARLAAAGRNELPAQGRRTLLRIALGVFREPMFLMIVAAGLLYLVLGDTGEALLLLAFVGIVLGITIVEERKTERVLEALRDLSSPRVRVVRDGEPQVIPGGEVVVGDIMLLEEGDRIAADAVLLAAHDLSVDESLLTGESAPVGKRALAGESDDAIAAMRPGGDGLPRVYAGSMVVQGGATARVLATGTASAIGRIGHALATVVEPESPLKRQTAALVRWFAVAAVLLSLAAAALYYVTRGNLLEAVLAGLALAMSMLPEEFPVILTVFMAAGAWRISKRNVLTRRINVIETLGAATVLCVDKTGTLTENRMSVLCLATASGLRRLVPREEGGTAPFTPDEQAMLATAVLASEERPFDPMELALHELAGTALPRSPAAGLCFVHEYPLTANLLAMTHVWAAPAPAPAVIATKGAPEAIARLCGLDAATLADIEVQVIALAGEGLRVLGVARAEFAGPSWPADPRAFRFAWRGLVAFADPLRANVPHAIAECRGAGIRVVMITGDYAETARAIGIQAGLSAAAIVTGAEVAALDEVALRASARATSIFARIAPEQKLAIVAALKANGEVVAMTGDGVNDAPALKSAHIGIAMGRRGTDVAREAASLVLLDDDFVSIVAAVRLGRRIYANLRRAMSYVLAVHVPIAGMALLPLLFGWPLLFSPAHIVFLELIINPTCSIVFEAEHSELGAMRRPPRDSRAPLFDGATIFTCLIQGGAVLVAVALLYAWLQAAGTPAAVARTMGFVALVAGNLGLIFAHRAPGAGLTRMFRGENPALWWVVGVALAALAITVYWPPLQRLFGFAPIAAQALAGCFGVGIAGVVLFSAVQALLTVAGRFRRAS